MNQSTIITDEIVFIEKKVDISAVILCMCYTIFAKTSKYPNRFDEIETFGLHCSGQKCDLIWVRDKTKRHTHKKNDALASFQQKQTSSKRNSDLKRFKGDSIVIDCLNCELRDGIFIKENT